MILSDETIARYIEDGIIDIRQGVEPEQVQPASLDVRIDNELVNINTGEKTHGLVLEPYTPYRGCTIENIALPNDIAAQLAGRSTVGRKGVIIHKTAGWIDPGFTGQITLELYNFTDKVVEFDHGDRIGQLVFFELDCPSSGYDGQYQRQQGPTKPGEI